MQFQTRVLDSVLLSNEINTSEVKNEKNTIRAKA